MGVGKIGGGGKGGPRGPGSVGKASGAGFSKKVAGVGAAAGTQSAAGISGAAGSPAADPVTAAALDIARALKSGQISSREEATRRLVAEVLREKIRMKSKALTDKIAETLQDDPRLSQALERIWAKV